MRPIMYIAGPYMDTDRAAGIPRNIASAAEIALALWRAGWAAICPHKNSAGFEVDLNIPPEAWYEGYLSMVLRSDAIIMIPGWMTSRGAWNELMVAYGHLIPVFYYDRDGIPPVIPPDCSGCYP